MPDTMLPDPQAILLQLRRMQRLIRRAAVDAQSRTGNALVHGVSTADTIYGIDAVIEPVIEQFLDQWSRATPLIAIAEGMEPETGRVFPHGIDPRDAAIRLILDPIDGTRALMFDKRSAWALAGAAPNRGPDTRLSDIQVAVMTELPTTKMTRGDVLWAVKGRGASGVREEDLAGDAPREVDCPRLIRPSQAAGIDHGFAMISNFFPGTKVLASEVMEHLVERLVAPDQVARGTVFEDQYVSTGGQFYELISGHDRFCADLRPIFYRIQGKPAGHCCHPYDCAAWLIAAEAGVILTDGLGGALDGPLDVTSGLSWAGFANRVLHGRIQPLLTAYLQDRLPAAREARP
jgi:hypothetical protein